MLRSILFLAIFITILPAFAQDKRPNVTLQDIWASGKFYPKGVYGIRHFKDGEHYTVMEDGKVLKRSYTNANLEEVLFDQKDAQAKGMEGNMGDYEISSSGKWLLISTNCEQIYRHSKKCTYYLWNFDNKSITQLYDGKKVFYATLSPSENQVAFVFENNLYYQNVESGTVTQVTNDGERNAIINGMSDWVYEEEFKLVRAFEWSKDGKYLAYIRFDESEVQEYQIPVFQDKNYPEMYTYKYPKSGEANSKVEVKIYSMALNSSLKVDLGDKTDIYIPRIKWTPSGELCITRMNRWQNQMDLLLCNAQNAAVRTLYTEQSETYIDVTDDLTFLENGFIISSERSGYNHLYYYNMQGELENDIIKGKYDVTEYLGYDKANDLVYYQSAEKSPLERHVYSVKLNGRKSQLITEGEGTHEASFSANFRYYIHTHSTINTPPVISLNQTGEGTVRVLEDNKAFVETWEEAGFVPFTFMEVKAADKKTDLNGWIIKPKDFDKSKKYPLLMFVYGGPGSQMVTNSWYTSNKAYFQYLVQQGYIVACFDNRGTGARGANFKKMTYLKLGKYEVEDQIAVAQHFAKEKWIDEKRIGIFGWSYGGYMASLCLARGRDVFSTAVAVAPVSDWRFYDNIYTERYMRRPKDNPEGYKSSSVLNEVDLLRGRNYMLVHGTFDDNVHVQNAYELMNRMVQRNVDYESELYVNKNHGIYGGPTRYHLFKRITHFLDDNLKNPEKP